MHVRIALYYKQRMVFNAYVGSIPHVRITYPPSPLPSLFHFSFPFSLLPSLPPSLPPKESSPYWQKKARLPPPRSQKRPLVLPLSGGGPQSRWTRRATVDRIPR